jgi:REP element-mobilizing transposase RayT
MARKLRLEYEGACYHVLNRGNYRSDIFSDQGAKHSFLECLDAAATKSAWVVHAWCLMSNHYHLAIETPKGNLVDGMRWLQVTFAMRFNRFRKENGHLFQGRYKSLIVDPGDSLGPLCHYIHLNPVRARIVTAEALTDYPWTSLRWLTHPRERRSWYSPNDSLDHAGGLKDTAAGRRCYMQYLTWLAEDETERKSQAFERMTKGWVIGTRSFKRSLREEYEDLAAAMKRGDHELEDLRADEREAALLALIKCLEKSVEEVSRDAKGATWKVAIAAEMKRRTTASNPWLSERLNMGSPFRLSRLVSKWNPTNAEEKRFQRKCAKCKI